MVESSRRKNGDIYREIVEILRTKSYNILQISEKTGINWETVKNAVSTLEKIDLVAQKTENNKTVYYVDESKLIKFNEDTLLGLPISDKQREDTLGLAKRIVQIWNKHVSTPLKRTYLQKMVIKLVNSVNINTVPYGWYLFGQCTILQLDPQAVLDRKEDIGNKYDVLITKIVEDFSQIPSTNELLRQHYVESGNDLYLTRLLISNKINNKFTNETVDSFRANVMNLMFNFAKNEENEELIEFINGFASIIIRLIKELPIEELEDLRVSINESFMAVWELIGTYKLYESARKFYDPQIIKKYYLLRIENLKHTAEAYLSELKDSLPVPKEKKDTLVKFKGIRAK